MDPLKNLKRIGYHRSFVSPNPEEKMSMAQFVVIAKNYICTQKGILFKDPIWDMYTNEEIIIEYFALVYVNDKTARETFEKEVLRGTSEYDDFLAFAEAGIEQMGQERANELEELPDEVSFTPDVMGE